MSLVSADETNRGIHKGSPKFEVAGWKSPGAFARCDNGAESVDFDDDKATIYQGWADGSIEGKQEILFAPFFVFGGRLWLRKGQEK